MTDVEISIDRDQPSMTLTWVVDAPVDRAWLLWADPRQLERWWGPPLYPATVVEYALEAGGRVRYVMTSPEGERYPGLWQVVEVRAPHRLVVDDAFADEDGMVNVDLPVTRMETTLTPGEGNCCTVTMVSRFATRDALDQVLAMGADEGARLAIGQIPDVLSGAGQAD